MPNQYPDSTLESIKEIDYPITIFWNKEHNEWIPTLGDLMLESDDLLDLADNLIRIAKKPIFIADYNKPIEEEYKRELLTNTPKRPFYEIPEIGKGYVYLLHCDGKYKIGSTKNPNHRFQKHTDLPVEPDIEACEKIDEYQKIETELHDLYANKRIKGEWFNLSTEDVEFIKDFLART